MILSLILLQSTPKMAKPYPKSGNTPKKQPKPLRRSAVKKKYRATGEAKVFREIWETRPHVCTNCKAYLGSEAKAIFFSHIKRKSQYPKLRLDPNNIELHCAECHIARDQGTEAKYLSRKDIYINC